MFGAFASRALLAGGLASMATMPNQMQLDQQNRETVAFNRIYRLFSIPTVYADSSSTTNKSVEDAKKEMERTVANLGTDIIPMLIPNAEALGFGTITGIAAGAFAKRLGKAAVVTFGGIFSLFQIAAYYDLVEVKWDKVEKLFVSNADLNKDGAINSKDAQLGIEKAISVLSNHMPATAGGFGAGFLVGLKKF